MTGDEISIQVHGRVQGVFFRDGTTRKAKELGLTGWVRNENDGTVFIRAQGPRAKLEELIRWCKNGGSPFAKVDRVAVKWEKGTKPFPDFQTIS